MCVVDAVGTIQDNGICSKMCRITVSAASYSASLKICRIAPEAKARVAAELLQACCVLRLARVFLQFVLDLTCHHPAISCSGTF